MLDAASRHIGNSLNLPVTTTGIWKSEPRLRGLLRSLALSLTIAGGAQTLSAQTAEELLSTTNSGSENSNPENLSPANLSEWKVCNETSFIIRLATAAIREGKMTPKGWSQLRPGACEDIDAPPGSPRYVFAESAPVHLGGIREWKGSVPLCAQDTDFKADATIDCALQDMGTRLFFPVDPTEKTTTLIEPDNFNEKAENAGIQRLLRDNGYRISRIDGIMGRRTSRTLRNYLKEHNESNSIPNTKKIDLLAKTAQSSQDTIGLTFCNKTKSKIWTAIAFRDDGQWESQGWWPVSVDDCLRPFTDSLRGSDAHFYARQEQGEDETGPLPDKHLRNVTPKPAQFCIAESRFAAIGREYCTDRGYIPASFRPLVTDKTGQKLSLTESDFSAPTQSGLRR